VPADRSDPVEHVSQSASARFDALIEANAGVGHVEAKRVASTRERDGDRCVRAGVFGGVLERFEATEVDGRFDLWVVASDSPRVHGT